MSLPISDFKSDIFTQLWKFNLWSAKMKNTNTHYRHTAAKQCSFSLVFYVSWLQVFCDSLWTVKHTNVVCVGGVEYKIYMGSVNRRNETVSACVARIGLHSFIDQTEFDWNGRCYDSGPHFLNLCSVFVKFYCSIGFLIFPVYFSRDCV